jgi:hypothetical protein
MGYLKVTVAPPPVLASMLRSSSASYPSLANLAGVVDARGSRLVKRGYELLPPLSLGHAQV